MNGTGREGSQPFGFASLDSARDQQGERGGALKIVLLVLGGVLLPVIVAVATAVWAVKRYAQLNVHSTADSKHVEISTPFGELRVDKAEDVAGRLKFPVYPGAQARGDSASVKLHGRAGEEEGGLDITVAEFLTSDSLQQVDAFYRKQLGSDYKREEGRVDATVEKKERWRTRINVETNGVSYTKETEGRVRGVAFEPQGAEVKIALFEIWEAQRQ